MTNSQINNIISNITSSIGVKWHQFAPDFCNDLNAMHKAEKTLDYDQQFEYAYVLDHSIEHRACEFGLIHTSARQRAEAFLKVHNKWIN